MPSSPVEPVGRVRTKIVATVGPASRSPVMLRALATAGVDVFRLNFSHGTQAEHSVTIADIRAGSVWMGAGAAARSASAASGKSFLVIALA